MTDFIRKLPKEIKLSVSLKENSEGFIRIRYYGIEYYVPVTKDFKKIFKAKRIKNRLIFTSYKYEKALEEFLRDLISSIYLQIRDTIGEEIHTQLNQEISEGFEKLFDKFLEQRINMELKHKTLEYKKND